MLPFAADVRSIETLHELRAEVCKFRTAAQDSLASVEMTIRRAYDWLAEQADFWKRAIRGCEEEVFQAKQELSMRKFPRWDGRIPDCTVQEENLKRAQAKLRHAQEKAEVVKRWSMKLPTMVSEVWDSPSKHLGATLEAELPRGIALLERRIQSLEAYAAIAPPSGTVDAPPPAAPPPEANTEGTS